MHCFKNWTGWFPELTQLYFKYGQLQLNRPILYQTYQLS